MGRPWGIVRVDTDAELPRWAALATHARVPELRIPVGRGDDIVVFAGTASHLASDRDLRAEIALLSTPDMTWDDVGRVLGDQMVFLPFLGRRELPYSAPGFESNTLVGGLDRLLHLRGGTVLDETLLAAARLALHHRLAIEVRP